ncbi:MAG: M50 family metallopeptidase [Cumulibacter sp.]
MTAASVADYLGDRFSVAGELTSLTLGIAVALAVLGVGSNLIWRQLRYLVTTVHEMGHVVVGWFVGRTIQSVRLNHDTSGLTITHGRQSGPGIFLLYLAGYPAPSIAGFAVLWAVIYQHAGWAMFLSIVMLLVCLALVRNIFGAFIVLLQLAAFSALWVWNDPRVLSAVLTLIGSVLSLGGLRACLDLLALQRRRGSKSSDAAVLAAHSPLGAVAWCYVFVLFSFGLLVVTAAIVVDQSAALG